MRALIINGSPRQKGNTSIALTEIAKQLENFEYVSFDLAHTEKGWDVIEINSSGQFLHQAGTLIGFRDELYQLIEKMDQIAPYRLRKYE